MHKISLYWHTVRHLKPSQIWHRLGKYLGRSCSVSRCLDAMPELCHPLATIEALDFDPEFLSRFPARELAGGRVEFLHVARPFDWEDKWNLPEETPLWNYNLHYFEFLFSLIREWKDSAQPEYLQAIKRSITGWIEQNRREAGGTGWDPYPVSMRLKCWLSCYTLLEDELLQDAQFEEKMRASMFEQYVHLANHLEKHLLANHYLENLTALVLCAIFFGDAGMEARALAELKRQCDVQVLPDGMHCERSPMYHKIMLEDLMRVAFALRGAGRGDGRIEAHIRRMLDAAWSLEEGLHRIPLFNDCGVNVAKSLSALADAAQACFGIRPSVRHHFPDGGFYVFRDAGLKLIVDAGAPGPSYNPGHAHSEAMSFELYRDGAPIVTNCGTYAYQCGQRAFFRSTAAHNTVMIDSREQSGCWGGFRVAKRCAVRVLEADAKGIRMEMKDQHGKRAVRSIRLQDGELLVEDASDGNRLTAHYHFPGGIQGMAGGRCTVNETDFCLAEGGSLSQTLQHYAPEYGKMESVPTLIIEAKDKIRWKYVCAGCGN